jgi:hypothetical protein
MKKQTKVVKKAEKGPKKPRIYKPKVKANEKNLLHSALTCNNCSFVKL